MELYLDNASTTAIHPRVKDLFVSLMEKYYASTGSLHKMGEEALYLETKARHDIATLLRVNPEEIFFNSGATEGNNSAIKGVAFQYQNRGRTIITTKVEHPSVLECVKQLEKDFNFKAIYLDVDENGVINLEDLKKNLNNDVILVSIMYVNNEVGSIMPIKEIGKILKNYPKVIFHSDITQAIGKIAIDFNDFDIGTMSSHKIHGMKGCGFIYKKKKVTLYPLLNGHPARNALKAGTSNWMANVTTALALKIAYEQMKDNQANIAKCQEKILEGLAKFSQVQVNMNSQVSIPNIINFSLKGYNPEVIIRALSSKGIYVSSRSACSVEKKDQMSSTLVAMHKDMASCISSIRVSLEKPLTDEEIHYFLTSLDAVIQTIRK